MTSAQTPNGAFWTWFVEHEASLFAITSDNNQVLDSLAQALNNVAEDLTFEIGPVIDGRRDLVISAAGIKSAFPAVTELVAAAPPLPRWRLIAFRPRRTPIMTITIGDTTVDPANVEFTLLSNGRELGLYLFTPGYDETNTAFGQIGYLMLDEALGEYDVETKVGLIKFFDFEAHPDSKRFPLAKLPEIFDAHYAELTKSH